MNDTHKLLLAMCEALDLDVERTEKDGQRRFVGYADTMGGKMAKYETDKIVDYKVTKKKAVNMRPEGFKITYKNGKWE